jgi:hypothetical protein
MFSFCHPIFFAFNSPLGDKVQLLIFCYPVLLAVSACDQLVVDQQGCSGGVYSAQHAVEAAGLCGFTKDTHGESNR